MPSGLPLGCPISLDLYFAHYSSSFCTLAYYCCQVVGAGQWMNVDCLFVLLDGKDIVWSAICPGIPWQESRKFGESWFCFHPRTLLPVGLSQRPSPTMTDHLPRTSQNSLWHHSPTCDVFITYNGQWQPIPSILQGHITPEGRIIISRALPRGLK